MKIMVSHLSVTPKGLVMVMTDDGDGDGEEEEGGQAPECESQGTCQIS